MKTVILSPHTDDAIFSLGDYIQRLEDVTIVSVFSGIPAMSLDDGIGYKKHTLLRAEHTEACKVLGVKEINGDFLDDVYNPRPTMADLMKWLMKILPDFDHVLAPIGIHHPDHVLLRETIKEFKIEDLKSIVKIQWYQDLPYAVLYPDIKRGLVEERFSFPNRHQIFGTTSLKHQAIACYQSQIKNKGILDQLLVTEEVYD